ncbi:MAG: prepilin-type N-terminal cleavage/methylation domain-containing protein [Candidatus Paceibacterota bacterium]|jgi:prepilin-type N-terminal cleavage/methylation domain-containing protein
MAGTHRKNSGFTLLEMILAIAIISVGVLGVHNGMAFAIENTKKAREYFMGAYLAQEGVEIVKNIRDNNWVRDAGDPWNQGLTFCASGCEGDYSTNTLTAWASGRNLKIDSSGFYNYDNGTSTVYKRKITVTQDANPDIMDITVDIYWSGLTTTVKENIYNWYQ